MTLIQHQRVLSATQQIHILCTEAHVQMLSLGNTV